MSTIRVNAIQNTSTTDGGISIDNSGHVTLDGQALPSAGPLSNRNLVINGAMQVAQRGTSSTANGYLLDRFKLDATGSKQLTQESLTSGTPYNEGFRNFLRLQNTGTATGATDYREILQWIEAQNIAQSGWNYASSDSYVTLSFWVRASVGQTYYVLLRTQDGTEQNYGIPFTLSADTWTKVTKTIPGNSGITINNDNGKGLGVYFYPFIGTDYTDSGYTTETWAAHSSSAQLPDMTNTWAGTTNATFDITGVQLEVGSVATPFERRSFGDELARCQRYYFQTGNEVGAFGSPSSGGYALNEVYRFPVQMRAAPSITRSYTGASNLSSTNNQQTLATHVTEQRIATGAGNVYWTFSLTASAEL